MNTTAGHRQQGFSLIEVLIALLITVIGSLGMIALQVRAQQSQLEAQQRSQALMLAEDMINRLESNPVAALERNCYLTGTSGSYGVDYFGFGNGVDSEDLDCAPTGDINIRARADVRDWDAMLKGATETLSGANVGGLVNARGCILSETVNSTVVVNTNTYNTSERLFTVAVTWQGSSPLSPPAVQCAVNEYNTPPDTSDNRRRAVTLQMHFGSNTGTGST